jgi:hypothetical protein
MRLFIHLSTEHLTAVFTAKIASKGLMNNYLLSYYSSSTHLLRRRDLYIKKETNI